MTINGIICTCFKLALKANGETMGGTFERSLLWEYLTQYSGDESLREQLLNVAIEWTNWSDGEVNDIAENRLREVHEEVTGIRTKRSWEKPPGEAK